MAMELGATKDIVDVLHGVVVHDPYRWLEDRDSDRTCDWIAKQRIGFEDYFQQFESLEKLTSMVSRLVDVETIEQIGKVATRYFYLKRSIGEQQSSIYVMEASDHSETCLVNPATFGAYASVWIHRISQDARLLAYEVKHGGEHTKEIHIVDVGTGRVLDDHLGCGLARGFAFHHGGEGFYYCHELVYDGSDIDKPHEVCFHRFGSSEEQDRIVLALSRHSSSKLVLKADGAILSALYYRERTGRLSVDLYATHQNRDHNWLKLLDNVAAPFSPFFYRERLFAYRYRNAPNGEIIELDPATGVFRRIIVPERPSPIKQCVIGLDRFYVGFLVGTETVVQIWSLDGEFQGTLQLESGHSWQLLPRQEIAADELFFERESFSSPPTIFRYLVTSNERCVWGRRLAPCFPSSVAMQSHSYHSKDGTEISISLVGRTEPHAKENQPVVMTAYGGFGVTLTPQFSPFVSILLDLGFLFAIPQIRGGNEKGNEWHEAARRRNRQAAFDDFIAAAEWLNKQGYTNPSKLAIFGGSNAGILVGAAITQRPELFRAALCLAPLLDMIRYHLFDRARVWAAEYGTADDPEDFAALLAYSPYHRVQDDTNYPAMMFVCGDKDTRCNPAHARKMAARLQNRAAQTQTILVDHTAERGHAPTMPMAIRTDAIAKRIAFLCHELDVPHFAEDANGATHN